MKLTKTTIINSIIVIVCFLIYRYSKFFYAFVVFGKQNWNEMNFVYSGSVMLLTAIVMALLATFFIKKKISPKDFGLSFQGLIQGLLYATLFTFPMLLGLGFLNRFNYHIEPDILYRDLVLAGFGEEFIFRAFLFGLLFYYCNWGFLPAGILSGIFFGMGHLYQAQNVSEAVSIFLFTTGANIGFAWFYYAWNNLWVVIFLHGFMDAVWDGFNVETNVTGNMWVNVVRFSTLILAVIISIRIAKKNNRYNLKTKLFTHKK